MDDAPTEAIPESSLNPLLRQVDWRFLLRTNERPRAVAMTGGAAAQALWLVADPAAEGEGTADLVLLGRPRGAVLGDARRALRPGGEVVCTWRLALPGRLQLARRALRRAGFEEVRVCWPGPASARPQFWLSLDSPTAISHLLAQRPARSPFQAILRSAWRAARRLGLLAPACLLARAPGVGEQDALPQPDLLLTGGERSINKVVGLPFGPRGAEVVVKFARVADADAALEREAEVLRALERDRPAVPGIPRVHREGARVGHMALVETAIQGQALISDLSPATFPVLALKVTEWLVELAGEAPAVDPAAWSDRLVGEPLAALKRDFGAVLSAGALDLAREQLAGLGPLPIVPEHRDCSPWNVLLVDGDPAMLDWESAEPSGLPGLDLIYFLANAIFVMDGALESGDARPSHARMLDPMSPFGAVVADSLRRYSTRLGLDEETVRRLRLLCWIVHCGSEHRRAEMEAAGPPSPAALREGMYLGLVEAELRLARGAR